ncbi:4,5-DOPA dioxygenase extradiol [Rubrivivax sp. A210]|uniref:4,5-DOPA-extradiol-dioxygenase n=1 Tax=Rubrivivax sp. A210 TaxID=2772301 RepID=UPI00191A524D|nr:4,5-DOPA dioxygenase extradiol [Rubrivivax sp. A210]CAD5369665.1 4,5-DOPA dioxygenase extradiol [Rubrivivax sp. A210]
MSSRRQFLRQAAGPLAALGALARLAGAAMAAPTPARMPTLFIGHGSPMNAIQDNGFSRFLRSWGGRLPRPRAILMVSAHWLTPGTTAVGVQARPRTIHDFGGFPKALFDMEYPAPGAPGFAREAAALVLRTRVAPREDWGLDHGSWTVLHHLYPAADVPVFQLSIDFDKPAAYHHALGRELAPLRERGVLIVGSGNVVHNLRVLDHAEGLAASASRPWAQAFDDGVRRALAGRDDMALVNYTRLAGEAAATAVPTPDHYLPLLYALGASDSMSEPAASVFEGFQAGTISMRCVQFGA